MKTLSILLLSLPFLLFSGDYREDEQDARIYFGFINDNYTGDMEQGIKGRYFGPDDFLTFSVFTQVSNANWEYSLCYNMVTSRKLQFRSDLLTGTLIRSFRKRAITLKPGAGIVLRDNLGGDELQNWFHGLTNVPELTLPFLDRDMGLILSGVMEAGVFPDLIPFGQLYSLSEIKLASSVVPSRLTQVLVYRSDPLWQRFRLELRGGARYYLNEVSGYSEMLRPGVMGGVHVEGRILQELHFRFGVTLFPGENLATDPLYEPQEFGYSPQIVTMVSWRPMDIPFQEFLKY